MLVNRKLCFPRMHLTPYKVKCSILCVIWFKFQHFNSDSNPYSGCCIRAPIILIIVSVAFHFKYYGFSSFQLSKDNNLRLNGNASSIINFFSPLGGTLSIHFNSDIFYIALLKNVAACQYHLRARMLYLKCRLVKHSHILPLKTVKQFNGRKLLTLY